MQLAQLLAHSKDSKPVNLQITRHDLPITIEHLKGTKRTLYNDAGEKVYEVHMHAHYGYFNHTKGRDGDEVDAIVGPSRTAKFVYIIHMKDLGPDKSEREDEDKCMVGFQTAEDAKRVFELHYPKKFFGEMTVLPVDVFKEKLASASLPHHKRKITAGGPGSGRHAEGHLRDSYMKGYMMGHRHRLNGAPEDFNPDAAARWHGWNVKTQNEEEMEQHRKAFVDGYSDGKNDVGKPSYFSPLAAGGPDSWIGVDLDGTLAKMQKPFNPYTIGEPVPRMVARVKRYLANGQQVKIFTARVAGVGENVARAKLMIQMWCRKYIGQALPVTNKKDHLLIKILDDRAQGIKQDTGVNAGFVHCPRCGSDQSTMLPPDFETWRCQDCGKIFTIKYKNKAVAAGGPGSGRHATVEDRAVAALKNHGYIQTHQTADRILSVHRKDEHSVVLNHMKETFHHKPTETTGRFGKLPGFLGQLHAKAIA